MAEGLNSYAEKIQGFTAVSQTDVENSIAAATGLAELTNSLSGTGGLWQALAGTKDLGTFSEDFPTFAENLKSYAEHLSNFSSTIKDSDITNSTNAAKGLAKLAQAIPDTGGLWHGLVGVKDLGDFSESFPILAQNLKDYASNLKDFATTVNKADVTNSTAAAKG